MAEEVSRRYAGLDCPCQHAFLCCLCMVHGAQWESWASAVKNQRWARGTESCTFCAGHMPVLREEKMLNDSVKTRRIRER